VKSAWLFSVLLGIAASAAQADAPEGVERKVRLLDRLLADSASRRKIELSNDDASAGELARALMSLDAAQNALARSEWESADQAAAAGLAAYSAALRAAGATRSEDAGRAKFQKTRERVDRFMDAYDRIRTEKALPDARDTLDGAEVDRLLRSADEAAARGDYADANHSIDAAASLVEAALTGLRRHETLVHELSFADPADAYRYERKRNESYALLVDLFESGGAINAMALAQLRAAVDANAAVRSEADAAFERGDAAAAIALLEDGTNRLAAALRRSGLAF